MLAVDDDEQVPDVEAPVPVVGAVQALPPVHAPVHRQHNLTEAQKWRFVAEYGRRTYGNGKIRDESLREVALMANVCAKTARRVWNEYNGKKHLPFDQDISLRPLNFGHCGIGNRKANEADIKGTIQHIVDHESDGEFISFDELTGRLRSTTPPKMACPFHTSSTSPNAHPLCQKTHNTTSADSHPLLIR